MREFSDVSLWQFLENTSVEGFKMKMQIYWDYCGHSRRYNGSLKKQNTRQLLFSHSASYSRETPCKSWNVGNGAKVPVCSAAIRRSCSETQRRLGSASLWAARWRVRWNSLSWMYRWGSERAGPPKGLKQHCIALFKDSLTLSKLNDALYKCPKASFFFFI